VGPGLRWNVHIEGGRGHLSPRLNVLENGVIVGRIFCLDAVGPQGRPWMWASGHNGDIRHGVAGGAFSLQEGPDCGVADVGGS
jgi:hypothetical protein